MAATPPICDFGWKAPDFSLPGTNGKTYGYADVAGPNGALIVFMCNHCPYVIAILDRLIRDAAELQAHGIGVAGICSNDAVNYPDDSFDKMAIMANSHGFPFPYLHDENQTIARAYDAICTPDFFGFNAAGELHYRGRIDGGRLGPADGMPRDLFNAMVQIAETGSGPREQHASMGCSIKWKAA
ncbi:MAG: thioredoxin family protein [Pseudomonadota bacterium]